MKNKTYNKKKILIVFLAATVMILGLIGRLCYLMILDAEYYQKKAEDLHEREREIKAARGEIVDRNGKVLATNKTVCTVSVIHSQIEDPEAVIRALSSTLELEESEVRKKVEKVSSMERIKTNVEKETGDKIREMNLAGVKVDEDFKRYYPYEELASKVLGFTGGDNQGIIGLEVKYEDYLKGENGKILSTTDARGVELEGIAEDRIEPSAGNTLQISIDYNIQKYAQQMAQNPVDALGDVHFAESVLAQAQQQLVVFLFNAVGGGGVKGLMSAVHRDNLIKKLLCQNAVKVEPVVFQRFLRVIGVGKPAVDQPHLPGDRVKVFAVVFNIQTPFFDK